MHCFIAEVHFVIQISVAGKKKNYERRNLWLIWNMFNLPALSILYYNNPSSSS